MADGVTEGPIVGVGGGVADNLASNESERSIPNCCLVPQTASNTLIGSEYGAEYGSTIWSEIAGLPSKSAPKKVSPIFSPISTMSTIEIVSWVLVTIGADGVWLGVNSGDGVEDAGGLSGVGSGSYGGKLSTSAINLLYSPTIAIAPSTQ